MINSQDSEIKKRKVKNLKIEFAAVRNAKRARNQANYFFLKTQRSQKKSRKSDFQKRFFVIKNSKMKYKKALKDKKHAVQKNCQRVRIPKK